MSTNISLSLSRVGDLVTTVITYTDPNGVPEIVTTVVSVPDSTPVPTVTLNVSPQTITNGQTATLSWTSTDALSVVGNNFSTGGATNGSIIVNPTSNTTYSITCTGVKGVVVATADLVVSYIKPIVTLTLSQSSITLGQSTVLTWTTSNATSAVATNFSTGGLLSGSVTLSPTTNTTYSMSCVGLGGTDSTSISVVVVAPAPTVTLSVSPQSIVSGQTATLTWSSTNSTSTTGTNFSTGGALSGTLVVNPTANTTYSISSVGAGGSASANAALTVTVPTGPACMNVKLVQGKQTFTPTAMAKPVKGVVYSEPNFGDCMVRATNHTADGLKTFARNDYSRRQAFNADNSLYLIYAYDGSWYTYNAATYTMVKNLTPLGGDAEPQWHPTDPNILYYVPTNGGLKLFALNVSTLVSTTAIDFTGKTPWASAAHIWTKSEGSPSKDCRYWGFQVEDTNFAILGFVIWDLVNNVLVSSMPANSWGRPDHCSMSPTGKWFIISWDAPNGTWAYSLDFLTKKQLNVTSEHSDIAIGSNGGDCFVSIDYGSNDGTIFMVDIDSGVRTNLTPTYINGDAGAFHFSGKAYNKPGWVVVGGYAEYGPAAKPWYTNQIFVMELAANPRIYALAYHRGKVGDYFGEPQCTVNRNFTKLQFNSDWGGAALDVDTYQLILSPTSFP